MFKLVIYANGKSLEKEMPDRKTAMAEAERIRKFPYAAEASIYRDDLMVAWVSHCPVSKSRNDNDGEME